MCESHERVLYLQNNEPGGLKAGPRVELPLREKVRETIDQNLLVDSFLHYECSCACKACSPAVPCRAAEPVMDWSDGSIAKLRLSGWMVFSVILNLSARKNGD